MWVVAKQLLASSCGSVVVVVLGFGSVADGVVATSTPSRQAAVACKLIAVFVFVLGYSYAANACSLCGLQSDKVWFQGCCARVKKLKAISWVAACVVSAVKSAR